MDGFSLVVTYVSDQEWAVCLDWKRGWGLQLQESNEYLTFTEWTEMMDEPTSEKEERWKS
jgi:hypothetical protein